MRKFNFTMQKVLNLKEKNREQEEWNYARILQALNEERDILTKLLLEKEEQQDLILENQQKGVSIETINLHQSYIQHIEDSIKHQTRKISKLEQNLSEKQQELLLLKIDEKKWLKLKEKKFNEFIVKENQIEQIEIDEIANKLMFR